MRVDRTKFHVLVAALSAACSPTEPPVAASSLPVPELPRPAEVPPPPAVTAPPPPQPAATAPPAVTAQPAPAAASSEDERYDFGPGGAVPPLARTIHPQSCAKSENAQGAVGACSLTRPPGPTCESFGDTVDECRRFSRWLVPKAAAHATQCLRAKSGSQDLCLFNVAMACAAESFGAVCLDPSPKIEADCKKVADQCARVPLRSRHMTLDACKGALSAIVPARREKFVHCAAESCAMVQCAYAADM